MKLSLLIGINGLLIFHFAVAQNVGIGTQTPQSPLHIKATAGEALRLQSSDPFIGFFDNAGNYGAYVWLNKLFGNDLRIGTPLGSNIAIAFTPNNSPSLYIAANGNVGIGNLQPNAPLAFTPTLGKKITLYPGATGDVGFGVAGNRLQIYSDNPNADVAIGYDAAGVFNERFAVKPNGAIALSANTGQSNQLLSSSGSNSAAQWRGISSILPTPNAVATATLPSNGNSVLFSNALLSFSLTQPSKVLLWVDIVTAQGCVFYPCNSYWKLYMYLNGNITIATREIAAVHNDPNLYSDARSIGPIVLLLNPGNYSIAFTGGAIIGQPNVTIYPTAMVLAN
jgi:hypothetical protein